MSRPDVNYDPVGEGIQRVTRTFADGRKEFKYKVNWKDSRGKRHYKTVGTDLEEAKAYRIDRLAAANSGKEVESRKGNARFKDVADRWLDAKAPDWKTSTERNNRWTVNKKLADLHDLRMLELDFDAVDDLVAKLRLPRDDGTRPAPASARRTVQILKQICEYARKRRYLTENPCLDLDPIKGRKPQLKMPSTEEVEQLVVYLARPLPERQDSKGRTLQSRDQDPRYALLVEVAAYTGLRAGELAGLRVADINFVKNTIRVERTIVPAPGRGLVVDTPKSDAGVRTVKHIDPHVIGRLRKHCVGLHPRDYVFGSRDDHGKSQPLHHGNFYRRIVKPAAEELGIDMTFHGLRHHAASLWIALGLTGPEVAANLGHHSAAFTYRVYAHQFDEHSRDLGALVAQRRAEARANDTEPT